MKREGVGTYRLERHWGEIDLSVTVYGSYYDIGPNKLYKNVGLYKMIRGNQNID